MYICFKFNLMKKIITVLLLFFTLSTSAQVIEGLGVFKINKTTILDIETYLEKENYYYEKITSSRELVNLLNSPNNAAALIEKSGTRVLYEPTCKHSKVIILNTLNIANLDLKKVILTFIDGVLVAIQGDGNSDLNKGFDEKYGKGKLEKKENKVECLYKLTGLTRELTEQEFIQTWNTENNSIYIQSRLNTYFDKNCEKQSSYSFSITEPKNLSRMFDCLNEKKELKVNINEL